MKNKQTQILKIHSFKNEYRIVWEKNSEYRFSFFTLVTVQSSGYLCSPSLSFAIQHTFRKYQWFLAVWNGCLYLVALIRFAKRCFQRCFAKKNRLGRFTFQSTMISTPSLWVIANLELFLVRMQIKVAWTKLSARCHLAVSSARNPPRAALKGVWRL